MDLRLEHVREANTESVHLLAMWRKRQWWREERREKQRRRWRRRRKRRGKRKITERPFITIL